ncbi:unnamed protein product [Vitrella brassicaformis CCMP3155]|uniref:Uncharacterized protein n=6 Tax=Vitrella brassicaformis TaxID=1169539 RepID=A0A0G4EFP9_VITBC|nr:unnamed protein product [Vitrella brassicaformis CCMP3155]|eukprot:CEL95350.1 unnamed protein product [Vitrella brassicaformis CCMP3155]
MQKMGPVSFELPADSPVRPVVIIAPPLEGGSPGRKKKSSEYVSCQREDERLRRALDRVYKRPDDAATTGSGKRALPTEGMHTLFFQALSRRIEAEICRLFHYRGAEALDIVQSVLPKHYDGLHQSVRGLIRDKLAPQRSLVKAAKNVLAPIRRYMAWMEGWLSKLTAAGGGLQEGQLGQERGFEMEHTLHLTDQLDEQQKQITSLEERLVEYQQILHDCRHAYWKQICLLSSLQPADHSPSPHPFEKQLTFLQGNNAPTTPFTSAALQATFSPRSEPATMRGLRPISAPAPGVSADVTLSMLETDTLWQDMGAEAMDGERVHDVQFFDPEKFVVEDDTQPSRVKELEETVSRLETQLQTVKQTLERTKDEKKYISDKCDSLMDLLATQKKDAEIRQKKSVQVWMERAQMIAEDTYAWELKCIRLTEEQERKSQKAQSQIRKLEETIENLQQGKQALVERIDDFTATLSRRNALISDMRANVRRLAKRVLVGARYLDENEWVREHLAPEDIQLADRSSGGEDVRAHIRQLERENEDLRQQLEAAEAAIRKSGRALMGRPSTVANKGSQTMALPAPPPSIEEAISLQIVQQIAEPIEAVEESSEAEETAADLPETTVAHQDEETQTEGKAKEVEEIHETQERGIETEDLLLPETPPREPETIILRKLPSNVTEISDGQVTQLLGLCDGLLRTERTAPRIHQWVQQFFPVESEIPAPAAAKEEEEEKPTVEPVLPKQPSFPPVAPAPSSLPELAERSCQTDPIDEKKTPRYSPRVEPQPPSRGPSEKLAVPPLSQSMDERLKLRSILVMMKGVARAVHESKRASVALSDDAVRRRAPSIADLVTAALYRSRHGSIPEARSRWDMVKASMLSPYYRFPTPEGGSFSFSSASASSSSATPGEKASAKASPRVDMSAIEKVRAEITTEDIAKAQAEEEGKSGASGCEASSSSAWEGLRKRRKQRVPTVKKVSAALGVLGFKTEEPGPDDDQDEKDEVDLPGAKPLQRSSVPRLEIISDDAAGLTAAGPPLGEEDLRIEDLDAVMEYTTLIDEVSHLRVKAMAHEDLCSHLARTESQQATTEEQTPSIAGPSEAVEEARGAPGRTADALKMAELRRQNQQLLMRCLWLTEKLVQLKPRHLDLSTKTWTSPSAAPPRLAVSEAPQMTTSITASTIPLVSQEGAAKPVRFHETQRVAGRQAEERRSVSTLQPDETPQTASRRRSSRFDKQGRSCPLLALFSESLAKRAQAESGGTEAEDSKELQSLWKDTLKSLSLLEPSLLPEEAREERPKTEQPGRMRVTIHNTPFGDLSREEHSQWLTPSEATPFIDSSLKYSSSHLPLSPTVPRRVSTTAPARQRPMQTSETRQRQEKPAAAAAEPAGAYERFPPSLVIIPQPGREGSRPQSAKAATDTSVLQLVVGEAGRTCDEEERTASPEGGSSAIAASASAQSSRPSSPAFHATKLRKKSEPQDTDDELLFLSQVESAVSPRDRKRGSSKSLSSAVASPESRGKTGSTVLRPSFALSADEAMHSDEPLSSCWHMQPPPPLPSLAERPADASPTRAKTASTSPPSRGRHASMASASSGEELPPIHQQSRPDVSQRSQRRAQYETIRDAVVGGVEGRSQEQGQSVVMSGLSLHEGIAASRGRGRAEERGREVRQGAGATQEYPEKRQTRTMRVSALQEQALQRFTRPTPPRQLLRTGL